MVARRVGATRSGVALSRRSQSINFGIAWTEVFIFLALLEALCWAAPVSSPSSSSAHHRWFYPCNGASAQPDDDVDTAGDVEDHTVDFTSSLQTISTKASRLKRHVRDLKNLYVRQRFRDDSIVEDLEQMGIRLAGMPDITGPTIESVNNADMIDTIHRAFEHLARVAVFVDQARIGETMAANEQYSYEQHFQRIEDHHDHGLYWLLCTVQQVVHRTRRPVHADVVDNVRRMRVVEVDRNSMRHTRDYLVLRDFERVLERIGVEFAALGRSRVRHYQPQRLANTTTEDDEASGTAASA